jgi:myo-inositol-1(or 4)-monophosphatase
VTDVPEVDAGELLGLARSTAAEAGGFLLEAWSELDPSRDVSSKTGPTDVVTRLDVESEQLVRSRLLAARPHDTVLGEEGGATSGDSQVRWVVDPLDGSVNYLFGLPTWAVSVAVQVGGTTVAGAVAVPALGRTYWAARGGGAFRDGEPLRASTQADLSLALLATGFAYDSGTRSRQAAALAHVLGRVRDIRRLGAAALDLCLLADGSVDAYYERGLNEWDYAAGALVAAEAGARVELAEGLCVGASPALFPVLRDLLRQSAA